MFVDFFIHRPVFATVCALLIILAGAICIPTLPVAMYPILAPPVVEVTATYVGADAQTVEKAVTIPLEEAINGVEGMRYISSSSTNSGSSADRHHLSDRLQPRHRRRGRAESRGQRGGPPARRSDLDRHHCYQIELQLCFRRRLLYARWPLFARVHLQLPRHLCKRRAQARARRGRCAELRRAQIRHARVARSGAAGGARSDRNRRGERARRNKMSRFPPASSASRPPMRNRPFRFPCAWWAVSPAPKSSTTSS